MIGKIIGHSILLSLLCSPLTNWAQTIAQDKEYKQMLEELNRRYEGFFIHENEQQRWERERRSGVQEVKAERETYENSREKARRGFVRTPPPDMEPLRLKWEEEQVRLERNRDKERQAYVKKRTEIEKIRDSARKIPGDREFHLE